MENCTPCFECLERQIHSDFSTHVVFRYGLSASPFPFGSSAIVQIYLSGEEDNLASDSASKEYVLVALPNSEVKFLGTRISPRIWEDSEDKRNDKSMISFLDDDGGVLDSDISSFSRMLTTLTPLAHVGKGSYSTIKSLALMYLSGETEDVVVSSINALMKGNISVQYGVDFLKIVGYPAFGENDIVDTVRHPNISPTLGILVAPTYTYLLHPEAPYTLDNILKYSPKALNSSWQIRFLMYQIISAIAHMHGLGVAHGDIRPASILMCKSLWAWLSISNMRLLRINSCFNETDFTSENKCCLMESCPCQAIYYDHKRSSSAHWCDNFKKWWLGEISNYEYLLVLNILAGRRWGDHAFHTVMPWVIDFTVASDENSDVGWRDLTKSKWRLAKGDEQLDFTYSSSEIPHHVSDECLSELAVCSYKARRLPLRVLRSAVRSVYEPNEYPSSMQRLYQWTPDECIPEFYTDPQIFTSLHAEMSDLALPSWAKSTEEFISLHRDALESDRVSQQIHHWIDITFGYKLSGDASIEAKNVMLPASDPLLPKSIGRTQLFTKPHPRRYGSTPHFQYHGKKESCFRCQVLQTDRMDLSTAMHSDSTVPLSSETSFMEALEEANLFCEYSRHLDPIYNYREDLVKDVFSLKLEPNIFCKIDSLEKPVDASTTQSGFDRASFLECFEADDTSSIGFQEHLIWRLKSSSMGVCSEDHAADIFAFGCILAELYLKKPLFSLVSFAAYKDSGMLPEALLELPPDVAILVEACIQSDWRRRPSAKWLLESQYFSPTVRSAYLFLGPVQLLAKTGSRLQYAAKLAGEGALKAMGQFTAEMCASYCLHLITSASSEFETESALCLLKEFLNCLTTTAIRALILPVIQKILQASENLHLKISILQDSFVRDLWKILGKQTYLEKMHSLVISNLFNTPSKVAASAASVVIIGSSEELGVPITLQQTILPLVQCFGKGLSADGIEALARIGLLLGETFMSRQILPLLRNAIISCLDVSKIDKPEPVYSLALLTLIDSFAALDVLISGVPVDYILKELIQEKTLLHVKVLMQIQLELPVIQVAATTLIKLCKKIGRDFTATYIISQLKGLFDELVFFQLATSDPDITARKLKVSNQKVDKDIHVESRMDLILLLYPFLASFIGIEKLRKCCSTWFFLEQILQRYYSWKWDVISETSTSNETASVHGASASTSFSVEYNQAKLLQNGSVWSHPQSQEFKSRETMISSTNKNRLQQTEPINQSEVSACTHHEPWFWFPVADDFWDGSAYLARGGGLKDEIPWKIKASILYSARAHPGAVRSIAVCHDECTVYTAGVGPGFKGSVQKWELSRMNCLTSYYGHDEVVNAICTLSVSGMMASCDGTIHVWNGLTGKFATAYAEASASFPLSTTAKAPTDQSNMLSPSALASGILSNSFSGSLYTCMHYIECSDKLVAGLGNGSVRFIDVNQGNKLHLWKSDAAEYSFSSLVSAICSCGSEKLQADRGVSSPSWIATGLSSGHCKLLDTRCGDIIAHWRAHDGYITKLAAPDDYLLLSSSFDKSLRVWDLRRNLESQSNVYGGHSDGITSFAVWGQDVISISRNKIGLTSLARSKDQLVGHHRLSPQTLCSADRGTKNHSAISAISILPFSRLFLVGTEDGYLKICC